jgi:putative nucleotidyltransferase with HDIG domain
LNLQILVSRVRQLPTLPVIVAEITRKTADPRVNAKEIGRIISSDLSITSKVLRTVNSAHYGFKREITDINSAIVALGFDAVRDIALSIAVFESLTRKGESGVFDRTKFWEHSLGVAVASGVVGRMAGYSGHNDLFLAGLLHDIGKVLLDIYTPEMFIQVIDLSMTEDLIICEAEKRVYGFTHAEAGIWLARQWNLPIGLQEAIGLHHNPSTLTSKTDFELTAFVHLADIFTRALGIGCPGDSFVPELGREVCEKYSDLIDLKIADYLTEIRREMAKSMSILKLA